MADMIGIIFTLLATFTFTAAFNIPGRFKNDEPNAGTAVLISKAAFKAFVISDSIAMTSSITAAVIVLWSSSRRDAESFMDTLPFANWIFVQPKGHSVCVGGYVVVAENANALLHLPARTFR
ncbi:hypothetical protein Goari_017640, partial [Gossypium aridum]|nr:hypothetical protein [Gossypium aridum]